MDIRKQQKTIEWICKRLNIVIRLLNVLRARYNCGKTDLHYYISNQGIVRNHQNMLDFSHNHRIYGYMEALVIISYWETMWHRD